jgi:hypothetical protein
MTGSMITVPTCWATRASLTRAEIVMLIQTPIQASSGVKMSWASRTSGRSAAADTAAGLDAQTMPSMTPNSR